MADSTDPRLISVSRTMADMTAPLCAKECKEPHSCCDKMFCNLARENAWRHGVVLQPTDHPTLPYMGPRGCIVPPHLRPVCTVYVCTMYSAGKRPGHPKWTKDYVTLRTTMMRLIVEDDKAHART